VEIDFLSSTEKGCRTVVLNSNSATVTVFTPKAGTRWVVLYGYIHCTGGASDLTFKSGSTAISGPIPWTNNEERVIKNAPFSVLYGDLAGEAFVIGNSASSQLNGWFIIKESEAVL
jgi:hypothetical protein